MATITKWTGRKERFEVIRLFYKKQNKERVLEKLMKDDPDWDIRGTVACKNMKHFIDGSFRSFAEKCPCEE